MKLSLNKVEDIDLGELNSEKLEQVYLKQLSERERKILGQIFTPRYIIRYILHQIPIFDDFKAIPPSFNLKILDPACGLGRFLLEAYDFLKEKLSKKGWAAREIHEFLLAHCLYGIDIEPLAVEFTRISLNMKCKNHPIKNLLIKEGNILLREMNKQEELKEEDFNVIIGNPPYFLMSHSGKGSTRGKQFHTTYLSEELIEKYRSWYKAWPRNNQDQNIFYLFIERGIQLLLEGGYLGFIIPDILLSGETTENLRKLILETCCIVKILTIEGQVFADRGISNIIIILQRCKDAKLRENNKIEVINTSTLELIERDKQGDYSKFDERVQYVPQSMFQDIPQNNFAIRMTQDKSKIFKSIFKKLEEGILIKMGAIVEVQRGIENLKKVDALDSNRSSEGSLKKLIASTNIKKYRIEWDATQFSHKFVDYNPQNPVYSHIIFKKKEWFDQPKIVLKRVSNKLVAALDLGFEDGVDYFYALDSVQMLWLKQNIEYKYDLKVILAILNSEFMNFYYHTLFSYKQLFSRVQKAFLLELPIPSEIPMKYQQQISILVNQLMKSYNKHTEKALNELIYQLYFTQADLDQFRTFFGKPLTLRDLPGI
ncbi:MAG TPA: N-6 DNA methylase, partial [Candidatus Deferrimicrobium sp.]|nr:N-6 DNA methylase [Candidatus Deferrimicrobium sp.]